MILRLYRLASRGGCALKIFISYRREDSEGETGRLRDHLILHLRNDQRERGLHRHSNYQRSSHRGPSAYSSFCWRVRHEHEPRAGHFPVAHAPERHECACGAHLRSIENLSRELNTQAGSCHSVATAITFGPTQASRESLSPLAYKLDARWFVPE